MWGRITEEIISMNFLKEETSMYALRKFRSQKHQKKKRISSTQ